MINTVIPSYFVDQTRKAWRDAGLACLAGTCVANTGGSYAAVAIAAGVVFLPSAKAALDAHRERSGDKAPVTVAAGAARNPENERRQFESSAFFRAVNKVRSQLSFEDFVTELANCSNMYGRRFSLTCVRVAGLSEAKRTEVADLLRRNVRASDEIKQTGDDEFVVCTPLLRDARDADVVMNRLRKVLLASDLLDEASSLSLGRALHPLDGYNGVDLIEAARNNLAASAPITLVKVAA